MNPRITDLDIDDVREGLASGEITLVDVREPQEDAAGHIPGSLSHPLSTFDPGELRGLAGRIVFSCASGVRSVRAIELAQASGLLSMSIIAADSRNGPPSASRSSRRRHRPFTCL